ncbi:MAG TPA: four helix bundle protein, partial [Longimicrobiales bacterium]|nr:four helix bundle protein [Longimicrobiales bacterium]
MNRRQFDFERLDLYHVCLHFYDLARSIIRALPNGYAEERDQLKRAALSIFLNFCEGAGEFSPGEKARFYRMALRSGTECAAIIRILEHDLGQKSEFNEAIEDLLRIVAM